MGRVDSFELISKQTMNDSFSFDDKGTSSVATILQILDQLDRTVFFS
jgi:hypothetical protein